MQPAMPTMPAACCESSNINRFLCVAGPNQVGARAAGKRQQAVKVQAVSRDAQSSSVTQKLATGALAAVVAAGALLPAPVMAADLALGKQVFEGETRQLLQRCSWLSVS